MAKTGGVQVCARHGENYFFILCHLLWLFQQFCDLDTTIIQQERFGQVKELI